MDEGGTQRRRFGLLGRGRGKGDGMRSGAESEAGSRAESGSGTGNGQEDGLGLGMPPGGIVGSRKRAAGPAGSGGRTRDDGAGRRPDAGSRSDEWPEAASGAGGRSGDGPPSGRRPGAGIRPDGRPDSGSRPEGRDGGLDEGKATSRKRRRTPRSDWQFPVLTEMGMPPERQRLLVIIATVVGVIAAGVGFVSVVRSLGTYQPERRATAAVLTPDAVLPAVFHGWESPKLFDPVAERAKDAKPLTEKEVFSQKELTVSKKLKLKLAAKKLDGDCTQALQGEDLLQLAEDAGCTQTARGLYLSSDGRYVGQYTLINLEDAKSAAELVEQLKVLYRGGWVQPLSSGKAVFPPGGYSEAGGYALGHYVGLVWLGRVDGAEPTAKDDFVSLTLALRGAEKAVYRRVVSITGPSS